MNLKLDAQILCVIEQINNLLLRIFYSATVFKKRVPKDGCRDGVLVLCVPAPLGCFQLADIKAGKILLAEEGQQERETSIPSQTCRAKLQNDGKIKKKGEI